MRKSIGTSTVIKNLQMRGLKFSRAIGRCTDSNMRLSTIVLNFMMMICTFTGSEAIKWSAYFIEGAKLGYVPIYLAR